MTRPWLRWSVRLAFSLFCGCACSLAFAAEALSRYQLKVGQELRYSGQSEFKYQGGGHNYDNTWRIWVARQNADGGWRLVLRSGMTMRQSNAPKNQPANERVAFAWCDMSPRGEIAQNETLGFNMQPNSILPRLPDDAAALAAGWETETRAENEVVRYRRLAEQSTPDKLAIEVVRENPMNEIYGMTSKVVMTFDVSRGLVEKMTSENTQTYGFNGKGTGTTQLDKVEMHDAAWTRDFAADADRYFAAKQAYDKAAEGHSQSPDELDKALKKAVADLKLAADAVKTDELKEQLQHDIKEHDQTAKYYLDEAKKRLALIDHPAAEWKCADLDGKDHALKDYRGRVVVLDFWYRGCGWCVRAMPQMKEVAAHFADRPVTVFGMNTDREEENARFVIDKMGLNYQNLKATGVPEKYKVQGFPTLLIIDQEGVLRDIHVGYAPDLKEKVVESIERLLKKS